MGRKRNTERKNIGKKCAVLHVAKPNESEFDSYCTAQTMLILYVRCAKLGLLIWVKPVKIPGIHLHYRCIVATRSAASCKRYVPAYTNTAINGSANAFNGEHYMRLLAAVQSSRTSLASKMCLSCWQRYSLLIFITIRQNPIRRANR